MVKEKDPQDCYAQLASDPLALLVDCRSAQEWELVGTPNLSAIGKKTLLVEWTTASNQKNPHFLEQIKGFATLDTPIIIMCRIGVRSAAACAYLAEHGFTNLTNMREGYEGRVNDEGHRNSFEGWRARKLPWHQS